MSNSATDPRQSPPPAASQPHITPLPLPAALATTASGNPSAGDHLHISLSTAQDANQAGPGASQSAQAGTVSSSQPANGNSANSATTLLPVISLKLIPYVDQNRPTHAPFQFDAIDRELFEGVVVKIGRQVNKGNGPNPLNSLQANKDCIWFKSKVVSRNHAEMWAKDGQVYLKDTASSSGTFLNHMRLSPSAKESRPYPLRNGDVIQLGIDYQGRQEDMYKCVVMKVQLTNKTVVQHRRKANVQLFRAALRALLNATNPYATSHPPGSPSNSTASPNSSRPSASVDCCICLCAIGPFQALFVAPCSHCYHYKCVQPLLNQGAMFQCALCRQVANLAASVSMDSLAELGREEEEEMERELMKELGFEGWGSKNGVTGTQPAVAPMDVVADTNGNDLAGAVSASVGPTGRRATLTPGLATAPPATHVDDSSDGEGGAGSGDGESGRATTPTGRGVRRPPDIDLEGRHTAVNSTEGLDAGRASDPETDGEGMMSSRRRGGGAVVEAVEGDVMDVDGDGAR
ncbi:hypothetical protein M427DRAFT_59881 [Gonapodya prolifera JEL478]|uniref:SMAD/FHA domain-containing protein n=1 Tax=Gonapodya prolifera (strain JEL478) TaxID=1344416 RepID=A0A139A5B3_GONPJ|nr:hypothetical protein M427DRAFT_59881 [Gonapodya prolifera JEL478]|eukprot:KXS12012.1 hypothetical protein M427DRAFT_59881 [Gonapodya prolifera JEL478]